MSQLPDIEDIVHAQPLSDDEKAQLFWDLIKALGWDIDDSVVDAYTAGNYLFGVDER